MRPLSLAVLVSLTTFFILVPFVSNAGLASRHYDWIISDCMEKSDTSACPALRDYLLTKGNGGCLKSSDCISHLKSKGIKDPLATFVCRWYFNDR